MHRCEDEKGGHQGAEGTGVHTWCEFPGMCVRCAVANEAGQMGKNHTVVRV